MSTNLNKPSHEPTPYGGAFLPAGLDWGFLVRTARSAAIVSVLVALPLSVYGSLALGARYLFFALWALCFFGLSALIFRSMMLNRDRARGLAAIAAKLGATGLLVYVLVAWPVDMVNDRAHAFAMLAGVATPLVVVVLRVLGGAMDSTKPGSASSQSGPSATRPDASAKGSFRPSGSAG